MVVTLLHNSGVVLLLIVGLMPTYAISHYEPRVQGRADSTCFIICSPWKGAWNFINRIMTMLCTL
jgi:hypothetical protein